MIDLKNFFRVLLLSILLGGAAAGACLSAAGILPLWVIAPAAGSFLILNICSSFRFGMGIKLKALADGNDLLCAFLILLIPEIVYVIVSGAVQFGMFSDIFWYQALIILLSESILFWNGIIRVYICGSMIGGKWRIIGILCGMLPIVNIVVLMKIITINNSEIRMEENRIIRNRERKDRQICKTRYPILLVHGVFFRDLAKFNYWGRIPAELEKNGAALYYGEQESALNIEESAKQLAEKIEKIIKETGCEKINIIAHSKGGLDSRYAISKLGMSKYVASLTTINTPHRGCVFAEWLLETTPESFQQEVASKYNLAFTLVGDKKPDFLGAVSDLRASFCAQFNENVPDAENVYYQSVGSKINKALTSVFPLNFSNLLAGRFDGPNDGLVAIDSAKWGDNFTVLSSRSPDGVSHADVIDLLRHDKPDLDIREFYVGLVSGLREKGY